MSAQNDSNDANQNNVTWRYQNFFILMQYFVCVHKISFKISTKMASFVDEIPNTKRFSVWWFACLSNWDYQIDSNMV